MMEHAPDNVIKYWIHIIRHSFGWKTLSPKNYVYQLTVPEGQFVLKRVAKTEAEGDDVERKLAAQVALLRYLKAHGLPVAVPIDTLNDLPYVKIGPYFYTLTRLLPNKPGRVVSYRLLNQNIGEAIARLHQALAKYPGEIISWKMNLPERALDEAVGVILRHQEESENQRLVDVVDRIRTPLTDRLTGLPCQYIHGDSHGGNILRVGEVVSGIVDLDHLPFGPRIYDLAYYLTSELVHCYAGPTESELWFSKQIKGLFTGYEQVCRLTEAEKDAVPYAMLAIMLIMGGWFYEPLNDPEIAQDEVRIFYWLLERMERVRESIP